MKQKEARVLAGLQEIKGSPEMHLIRELLQCLLDEAKENLITCEPATCGRLQGQAEAYRTLLRRLDRRPLGPTT